MGIRMLMKSLIPVKQGKGRENEGDTTAAGLSVIGATGQEQESIQGSPTQDSDPDTPVPCETTASLQKGKRKINKEIMNIFVEEEASASQTRNLAAGLPDVPVKVIYRECKECLELILMLLKRRS